MFLKSPSISSIKIPRDGDVRIVARSLVGMVLVPGLFIPVSGIPSAHAEEHAP